MRKTPGESFAHLRYGELKEGRQSVGVEENDSRSLRLCPLDFAGFGGQDGTDEAFDCVDFGHNCRPEAELRESCCCYGTNGYETRFAELVTKQPGEAVGDCGACYGCDVDVSRGEGASDVFVGGVNVATFVDDDLFDGCICGCQHFSEYFATTTGAY